MSDLMAKGGRGGLEFSLERRGLENGLVRVGVGAGAGSLVLLEKQQLDYGVLGRERKTGLGEKSRSRIYVRAG